ncbi:MAG TPA: protease pro-enzyme activation domain-containing protein [Streptosporangiaceae bacterium]|nr:protease pro-enzyme activation domain-containing protein [Streptosporangiaceae bacterium]
MKRLLVACSVVSVTLTGVALGSVAAASAAGTAVVGPRGTVTVTPSPHIPAGAKALGPVPGTASVSGAVVLRPRDEASLIRFIGAVTTPGSALFHRYLPAGAFARAFGPAQASVSAVRSRLAADGLRVTSVARDGLLVGFAGSAKAAGRAFHTGFERYRLSNGALGRATTGAVRLPATIAPSVSAVIGLDNLVHAQPVPVIRAPAKGAHRAAEMAKFSSPAGAPKACADAKGAATAFGGLTDDQIAHTYGAFGLYGAGDLAAGQRIAVYELEPFLPSDIHTFDSCYFGPTVAGQMAARLHVVPVDGGQPTGPGFGEAVLDVEDVSAIAAGANIDVYEAPNTAIGGLDEYAAIINTDTDKVITSSWGLCEQALQLGEPGLQQAENVLFQQAAAQGQSTFAAAGDTGSDSCNAARPPVPASGQNPLSVLDPASQPYVIAVGGTTIDNAATQPPGEHVWNDGANWGAGGGGISQSWAMPAWQLASRVAGIVLPGSADYTQANSVEGQFGYPPGFCQSFLSGGTFTTPCRTLPDVSAQADEFTGAVTVYSASFAGPGTPTGWATIGGTSSATPIWAGLLAVVNASPTCKSNPATAGGVGFASPLLYDVASHQAEYTASFNDITAGDNDNYGLDNGLVYPAAKGYDLASGLGSPQLTAAGGKDGLAFYLCGLAASGTRPAVTGLSPSVLPTTGGKVTITGNGFKTGTTSEVAGIQIGTWELPAGKFTVNSATSITATFPPAKDTLPPGSPLPLDGAGPARVSVASIHGEPSMPGPASTLQYVDENGSSPVPSVTGVAPFGGLETAPAPVTVLGSGFTGTTDVTFGGVNVANFRVVSPFEIQATPAPYSGATNCAPSVVGETPTTDICQTQVQVTNAHGTSADGTILPPLEGTVPALTSMGVFGPPAGCGCEVEPAPTEYDYVPAPAITSVSTSAANPASLASENGGTVITVNGKGFNLLTIDYADFGNPALAASANFAFTYLTGSQLQVTAPGGALTTAPATVPFSMRTLGGQSAGSPVTYAGVPSVSGVVNTATSHNGGPDTGGTAIAVSGQGLNQATGALQFVDSATPFSVGTQYNYTVNSGTSISAKTVQQNPALVHVEVCSVTACSTASTADEFYLYPPGNPKVTSISPASGLAAGGTKVVIGGQNLGCVTGVFFGAVAAATFSNAQALLDCGATTLVNATSPAGTAGTKVKVTITTVESNFTGTGPSQSTATFTYTP